MAARDTNDAAAPRTRSTVPALALGAHTWLVAAGWPLLRSDETGLAPWIAGLFALGALGAGAALHAFGDASAAGLRYTRDAAFWLVFPIATCAASASAYDAAGDDTLALLPLLLGPLSLAAYGAALVSVTARAPQPIAVELTPLRAASAARPPHALRSALPQLLFGGGAIALGLVLPALGDPAALAARWGDGRRPGAVLAAILGGALAAALLGSFLPSALRRDARDLEPRPDAALRATWYLFLSLLGAVTYYVVQP
jgi:uncharacterized protein YjeT (DUF2065 family)